MERIGTCGAPPDEYVISQVRLERRGYYSVLSYAVEGLRHWMEVIVRRDGANRPYKAAAFVLPVDFANREVYLIRAPRHNRYFVRTAEGLASLERALRDGGDPRRRVVPADVIDNWDTAAGMVEPGEPDDLAALREAEEELGMKLERSRLNHVCSMNGSIGVLAENLEGYVYPLEGRVDTVAPKGDGDERHAVWRLSFEEAFDLLDRGEFPNAGGRTLIAHLRILDLQKQLATAKG